MQRIQPVIMLALLAYGCGRAPDTALAPLPTHTVEIGSPVTVNVSSWLLPSFSTYDLSVAETLPGIDAGAAGEILDATVRRGISWYRIASLESGEEGWVLAKKCETIGDQTAIEGETQ